MFLNVITCRMARLLLGPVLVSSSTWSASCVNQALRLASDARRDAGACTTSSARLSVREMRSCKAGQSKQYVATESCAVIADSYMLSAVHCRE